MFHVLRHDAESHTRATTLSVLFCTAQSAAGTRARPNRYLRVKSKFVIDQIKCIGKDPALLNATLLAAREQASSAAELQSNSPLESELGRLNAEMRKYVQSPSNDTNAPIETRRRPGTHPQCRAASYRNQRGDGFAWESNRDESEVESASSFTPVWDSTCASKFASWNFWLHASIMTARKARFPSRSSHRESGRWRLNKRTSER